MTRPLNISVAGAVCTRETRFPIDVRVSFDPKLAPKICKNELLIGFSHDIVFLACLVFGFAFRRETSVLCFLILKHFSLKITRL